MNERHAILDAWQTAAADRSNGVLCTVVEVQGSAYRRPGARMLFFNDGRRIGSISGGCLEGDVCRKGWWLTHDGQPALRVYDTLSDEDAVWEFGLGCNGIVHVLLERADSPAVENTMHFLQGCRRSNTGGVIATVLRAPTASGCRIGDRLYLETGLAPVGPLCASALSKTLPQLCAEVLAARKSRNVSVLCGGLEVDLFLEWIGPPVPLLIFGAGHDAIPLVAMAKELGWNVTVADGRPAYARPERFPAADRVVLLPGDGANLGGLDVDEDSVVVVMTHNYPQDEKLLRSLLPSRPRYLGLLGPQKRADRLFADLGEDLQQHRSVHAPVGLDIGAEDPASIAISILSEVQAALSGRAGGNLRARSGPIHARDGERPGVERAFNPAITCAA